MDRTLIVDTMTYYRGRYDNVAGAETRLIVGADDFLLVQFGWLPDGRRMYDVLAHYVIREDKLWIEVNQTEIVDALVAAGMAHGQIVLALYPKAHRTYTTYAVE